MDADAKRERAGARLLGGFTLLAMVAWMGWSMTADRRAITRLPPEQRRMIFEHTVAGVRECGPRDDSILQRRCREQAEFLLAFPECDAECQELVAPLLRKATPWFNSRERRLDGTESGRPDRRRRGARRPTRR